MRSSLGPDEVKNLKIDVISASKLEAKVHMTIIKKNGLDITCQGGERKMVKKNGKWLFEYTGMWFPFRGCSND